MTALTSSLVVSTELAGKYKIVFLTVTIAAASDTITFTEKTAQAVSFVGPIGCVITGGLDTLFSYCQVSVSGLVVTVASFAAAGTSATDFTGTTVAITLLAKNTATT